MRVERTHLLVVLAAVTGIVDAFSFLGIGRVFVANMTGNVVFVGFALAGVRDPAPWASLLAIAAFAAGAFAVGRLGVRFATVTVVHALLVAVALGITLTAGVGAWLIVPLGVGMGMQNAVVRSLAIPDLATNVLTTTLTGLAADRPGPPARRRLASLGAMLLGAFAGAALHLHAGSGAALGLATALMAGVAALACLRGL